MEAEQRANQLAELNVRAVAVANVAAGVTSILDIDELLTYVTDLLRTTFDYHTVYVFLREPESNSLVLKVGAGGPQGRAPIGDRLKLEEGISGWVARTGEAVLANDARTDPRFVSVEEFSDTRAQLSVPIKSGEEVLGVLGVEQAEVGAFGETDLFTAQTLAHQLAVAIENARANERLDVLNELMRIAVSSVDVAETFDGVRRQVQELIDHDRLSIDPPPPPPPPDGEGSELLAFAAAGPGFLEQGAGMPLESPPGEVIRTGHAVLRTNFPEDSVYPIESEFAERFSLRSFMFVPLRSKGNVIGSLNFGSLRPGRYTAKELEAAQQIADHLAVIVEHTLLYEESRDVAVLEERNRMAREIHDTLAQGFTGIVLQLEAAEGTLDQDREPDAVREHLTSAKDLARGSLQEARRSVWNLLPRALEEHSLDDALREEVQRVGAESGERASFSISGQRRELPADVQAALLRICQESLTNVVKHVHATDVQVELAFEPASVLLRVRDNGRGFDVEQAKARPRGRGGGFGLSGMEQRTRLLRGSLTLMRDDGGGTLVEASIPTR